MNELNSNRIMIELNPETTLKIDVLIEEGLYSTHSDFLERAIERQLDVHESKIKKSDKTRTTSLGVLFYSAKDLEDVVAEGKQLELKVIGFLKFSDDVTTDLVERAIAKISLTGILRAPPNVILALNQKRFTFFGRPYYKFRQLKSKSKQNNQQYLEQ